MPGVLTRKDTMDDISVPQAWRSYLLVKQHRVELIASPIVVLQVPKLKIRLGTPEKVNKRRLHPPYLDDISTPQKFSGLSGSACD